MAYGFKTGGRKKGSKASHTLAAEKAREFLINEVVKDLEPIVTAQKEAAKGMWIEQVIGRDKVRVYQRAPELRTGEYLLNQVAGKPRETIEMSADVILKLDV